MRKLLKRMGKGKKRLVVGTACSGSGILEKGCGYFMDAMMEVASMETIPGGVLEFGFCCDNNEAVQRWLRDHFPGATVFKNIEDLGMEFARDVDDSLQRVQDCDILVVGFSCKDFSSLNVNTKHHKDAVKKAFAKHKDKDEHDEPGSDSAETLLGVMKYIEKKRPAVVMLENVPQFDARDSSNWKALTEYADRIGYKADKWLLDTRDYFLPQARRRLYMVLLDADLYVEESEIENVFAEVTRTLENLKVGSLPLAWYMQDEDTCEITFQRSGKRAKLLDDEKEEKWVKIHREMFAEAGLPFDENHEDKELLDSGSAYKDYAPREKSVAHYYNMMPCPVGQVASIVDLSQSLNRGAADVAGGEYYPTVRPRAKFFNRKKKQLLGIGGIMRVQGLHPADWPYADRHSSAQVMSITGNAFSGTVAMAVFASVFTHCTLARREEDESSDAATETDDDEVPYEHTSESLEADTQVMDGVCGEAMEGGDNLQEFIDLAQMMNAPDTQVMP